MTATSPEAIERKQNNKQSKKDIEREDKIKGLGGTPIEITYGTPLTTDSRQQRINHLYDLMYPRRGLKTKHTDQGRKVGRPRIYTDEQRKEKSRESTRKYYYNTVGYVKGERPPKDLKHKHPSYNMYANAKRRAKKNDLDFDLDVQDILIPEFCPILGIKIEKGDGWYTDNSPTLDRIIPELGYIKSNVWVISMRANRLKQDATLEELEKIYLAVKAKLNIS